MQKILFNSRLELDRLPLGAVEEGSPIRIGLRTLSSLGLYDVKIIIRNDDTNATQEYPLTWVWSDQYYSRFEAAVAAGGPGLYWYWFTAKNSDGSVCSIGRTVSGAEIFDFEPVPWQLTVFSSDYTTPDWIKGGVFYHIFVDRFNKSGELPFRRGSVVRRDWGGTPNFEPDEKGEIRNNDFFGGNLEGIIEKLPYLNELGVTCIYLSPIFEAASNHKYDTSDYMKVDPSFGDEETLTRLCREAKSFGMSVICDGVFNHTGDDSVYFDRYGTYGGNGAYSSKLSPYYPWYSFSNWPHEYEAWWGIKTLPQVREDNPDYRNFILGENGVIRHWLRAGISGWRLDVADELPEPFLKGIREAVKEEKADGLIIGEVWEDATTKVAYGSRRHYLDGSELDSVMNYPFKNAIIDYALGGDAETMRERIESICENYPKPALDCAMNGLGTHDTPRILTMLGGRNYDSKRERAEASLSAEERKTAVEKLKAASLLQCTLPGVPCIYYGDEVGLEGYEDPFNRRCYPWGREDMEILEWYKALLKVRRECPAFDGGDCRVWYSAEGVFTFSRTKGRTLVLTVVNMSDRPAHHLIDKKFKTLISNRSSAEANAVLLEPYGCALLELF